MGIRRAVLACLLLTLVSAPRASEADDLVGAAIRRYRARDDSGALALLQRARTLDPGHREACWQEAYMLLVLANRSSAMAERRRLCGAAVPKVESVLVRSPRSADAWFVGGLAQGVESGFASPRRKVELSKSMRARIARCLALDPGHAGGWFLLGRWHEGFATLNPVERGLVDLLLGGMPEGTSMDSARLALERAAAIRPSDLQIQLDLARVLVRLERTARAREVARRALAIPAVSAGDQESRREIEGLLRRL